MENLDLLRKLIKSRKFNKRFLAENIVIEHGDFFYKSPTVLGKVLFYGGENVFHILQNNYNLINSYFGDNFDIAETDFYEDKDLHCIIRQKKLYGDILGIKELKDIKVKESLRLLLDINIKLWEEKGVFLDILGTDTFYSPFKLHNLIISNDKISIFDFGLLNRNSNNFIFKLLSNFFYYLQVFWIKIVFLRKY